MLIVPALGVFAPRKVKPSQGRVIWLVTAIAFALTMGLRHEVGGDWFNYLPQFINTANLSLLEAIGTGDPGYSLVNWLVGRVGGTVYHVNLVCAGVMMWGTAAFCRRQQNPWLALLTAVPYMLIVVGMGYTRQSVALGFVLLGLVALGDARVRTFVIWIGIAATFHKSAVLLLPIAALATSRNRLLTGALVGASGLLLYYLLVIDATEALWQNYVVAQYHSEGALVRVLMNVLPAVLLILFRRRLAPEEQTRRLWLWIAVFALACVPLVGMASTAVDRIALYLIPLQLFVFSRLPLLAKTVMARTMLVLGVVGYYTAVQFVWLHFAAHARHWVPYQLMPIW